MGCYGGIGKRQDLVRQRLVFWPVQRGSRPDSRLQR
jgi:hypothetical protein